MARGFIVAKNMRAYTALLNPVSMALPLVSEHRTERALEIVARVHGAPASIMNSNEKRDMVRKFRSQAMQQQAEMQPPPPNPEMLKIQAQQQAEQFRAQNDQQKFQAEQQMQMQMSGINVIAKVPPQLMPGKKIDLGGGLTIQFGEGTFLGPDPRKPRRNRHQRRADAVRQRRER